MLHPINNLKCTKIFRKIVNYQLSIVNSPRGFTLIELLIVISIIGILSTIATLSLGASQRRARDGQRKSDIKQVQNALEIYFSNNSLYPDNSSGAISGAAWGSPWSDGSINYMRIVPRDPLSSQSYCYNQTGSRTGYNMFAKLENTTDPDYNGTGYTCTGGSGTFTYQVQNPY